MADKCFEYYNYKMLNNNFLLIYIYNIKNIYHTFNA